VTVRLLEVVVYKSKIGILVFCVLFLNLANAGLSNQIDSPDGLYYVSHKGVGKISVKGKKDKDGVYKIQMHNVVSIYSVIKPGYLTVSGWWYPGVQQFYTQNYERLASVSGCDKWGDIGWGFKFEPAKINISGKDFTVYKEIYKYGKNKKPKDKYCVDVRINTRTCERHKCNAWKKAEPKGYIVGSKAGALVLFRKISG